MNKNKNKNKKRGIGALLLMILLMTVETRALAAQDPLVMGVFPRRNATLTTHLFTPLAHYLSSQLGREVKLVTAKDFPAFWRGVSDRRYDLVHYNQYHYISSARDYRVVAHNKEFGRSDVAGALYVRRDSGITHMGQLKGRRIVFGGGEDAMMSYILPRYLLLRAGLTPRDYTSQFATSPPNALMALYFKQSEASGAGDILIDLPVVKRNIDTQELIRLGTTEPLLHLPWAVRRDMDSALRGQLQALLVGLEASEDGRQVLEQAQMTGIGAAEDADYDAHRHIVAQVRAADTLVP